MNLKLTLLSLFVAFSQFAQEKNPLPKYEMRGVWVATVDNIDWPSQKGTTIKNQKNEYVELLDSLEKLNMNTVLFQVRPQGDAFYKSSFEPWSEYLMGKQGQAPASKMESYDPLQFIIEQTHRRGMEFHAWLNPYRISIYPEIEEKLDTNHIYFKHPEWFVKYGERYYFNPGVEESKEFVLKVVKEIVSDYDIDALHFDDYFYPYEIKDTPFPDSMQYANYVAQYDSITNIKTDTLRLDRDTINYKLVETKREFYTVEDWRRGNVNTMVEAVYNIIQETKPWVKFGISPFGVWRNKSVDDRGSDTRAGQTNYDNLYADVLYWLDNGWVDYLTPQIYWRIDEKAPAPFDVVANWWSNINTDVKIFVGQGVYRLDKNSKYKFWQTTDGFSKQIEIIRAYDNLEGSMHFSAKHFKKNPLNINQQLSNNEYSKPAIAPSYPDAKINTHQVKDVLVSGSRKKGVKFQWSDITDGNIRYYLVYRFEGEEIRDMTVANNLVAKVSGYAVKQQFEDTTVKKWKKYTYSITSVDRFNVESISSKPVTIKVKCNRIKKYK
ncbi:MAG: family 10 glycosylhydrolase [Bacteroidota bacterium]